MAQTYTTTDGTLVIPGAYSRVTVQAGVGGLATNGVLALVGESDKGPRFSLEDPLRDNYFGADSEAEVRAKYGSGNLVDAYLSAVNPSLDSEIVGAPSRIYILKTNGSTKASSAITGWTGTYGTLYDKSYGALGNNIYFQVSASVAEVLPTTGTVTYIPAVGTVAYGIRVNGAASVGGTLTANMPPDTLVSTLTGLTGVLSTGGVNRNAITVSGTLAVDANPAGAGANVIDLTRSIVWAVNPTAGDTLVIPTGSVVAGAGSENIGAYVITSVSATVIRATKLSDAGKGGATPGTITAPADVAPVSIAAVTDAAAWSPVVISCEVGDPIDGIGKSLEVAQLATGTDLLERCFFNLATTTAVTWTSKTGSAKVIVSAAEYKADLEVNRLSDSVTEDFIAGGDVALKISYTGTTGTVTITDTALTTTVTGGSGANLSLSLASYPTIADLAAYINIQTGYSCSVGTATLGQYAPASLDNVTAAGICSTFGAAVGRLKMDGYKFFVKLTGSTLVQLGDPAEQAVSGLPKTTTTYAYLSGGAKGGTTDTDISEAFTALERLNVNFIVPLMSRDATSDILDSLTEASSTYTIASIHAQSKAHVAKMKQLKRRRPRQVGCSIQDTFANCKDAASNLANEFVHCSFLDKSTLNSAGSLVWFQPWMDAVLALAMQAAGTYKSIFNKKINCSGTRMWDGSYDDQNQDQVEEALEAGLLPCQIDDDGGYSWVSDQTTYGKDNNFAYNSIQAMYALNLIRTTAAADMGRMFTGKSYADFNAEVAKSAFEKTMEKLLKLKLIAPAIGAPKGWRNMSAQISAPGLAFRVEVKLATCNYFTVIDFLAAPVEDVA